jgi:hypothetical protein
VFPALASPLGPGPAVPPDPTVTGYDVTETGKAAGPFKGWAPGKAVKDLQPPAPEPPDQSELPPAPPATTKYSTLSLTPVHPNADTAKVPGPVNICVLKLPQSTVVPPVACINVPCETEDCKPSSVTNQPCVESINIKVTAIPSVVKSALRAEPPILSEPF